jgi:hypothetical protein
MFLRKLFVMVVLLLSAVPSYATAFKAHVAEFKVTGSTDEGLKTALQAMLASRLPGENLTVVRGEDKPDFTILCTYIVFGKIFSLDGQIVAANGKVLGRAFEQGESVDQVIPAVGRLAEKLNKEIARVTAPAPTAMPTQPVALKGDSAPPPPSPLTTPDIIKTAPVTLSQSSSDIILPEAAMGGVPLKRLDGVLIALTAFKDGGNGKRTLVVAAEKELRLYEAGEGAQLLATEKGFGGNEKIVSIDAADLDKNGTEELYVTVFSGEDLASRVYEIEQGKFRLTAQKLPYFFRAIALSGADKKIYVQQLSTSEDFYGDLHELVKNGAAFEMKNPLKLPKFANIYNFNKFSGKGESYFVSLSPDGYLTVTGRGGETLWKGGDKFGGTEAYFSRDDGQNIRFTGSSTRKVFLEQRLTVTADGTVIVPKNEGSFVVGNSRNYTKSSVYAFRWNGVALEEVWHTKPSQSYLTDYLYDDGQKTIVTLEVVKRDGFGSKGISAISVKKVD